MLKGDCIGFPGIRSAAIFGCQTEAYHQSSAVSFRLCISPPFVMVDSSLYPDVCSVSDAAAVQCCMSRNLGTWKQHILLNMNLKYVYAIPN